jgi:hypothetical protein
MSNVDDLRNIVDAFILDFTSKNNKKPAIQDYPNDIKKAQDEILNHLKNSLLKGQCTFFIKRKTRYCSRKATINSSFCTMHRDNQDANSNTLNSYIPEEGRKKNLKRPPKRMLNPFFINNVLPAPDWSLIYSEDLPLCLDIGSAKGMSRK